jgi:hypothetical protein
VFFSVWCVLLFDLLVLLTICVLFNCFAVSFFIVFLVKYFFQKQVLCIVIFDFKHKILRWNLELLEEILGVPYMGETPLMGYNQTCIPVKLISKCLG